MGFGLEQGHGKKPEAHFPDVFQKGNYLGLLIDLGFEERQRIGMTLNVLSWATAVDGRCR